MSKGYSRQQKKSTKTNTDSTQSPAKHIKTGFSALQKTIALVGSVLSIIVASITITNAIIITKTLVRLILLLQKPSL